VLSSKYVDHLPLDRQRQQFRRQEIELAESTSPLARLAYFDYQPSRRRDGPQQMLKNFAGYLQTDGCVAHEAITCRPEVTALGCMAFAYLKDLFSRIADSPHRRAAELLPQNWKNPSPI